MKALRTNNDVFVTWAIYDHPADHPNHFVLRRWEWMTPDKEYQLFDTIEEARAAIPPGLIRFCDPNPVIAESWI